MNYIQSPRHYSLATIEVFGRPTMAVEMGGTYWRIADLCPDVLSAGVPDWISLLANRDLFEKTLAVLSNSDFPLGKALPPLRSQSQLLAPLLYPGKVIGIGLNYPKEKNPLKLREDGAANPVFFFKPARTSIVGSGQSVIFPKHTNKLDWEIELAVVIGQDMKDISADDALNYVAGYSVAVDLSARDYLGHNGGSKGFDVIGGKAFDCSCPVGPHIVPAQFVADPQNLILELQVNGVVRQRSNTRQMILSIAKQLSWLSNIMTLEPGDLLLTGTPSGSGVEESIFLNSGDSVEAEIESIGRLKFEITGP